MFCTEVPGFKVLSNGNCGEVCGDGVQYTLQCDDGNTLDGDGCSSQCTIEKGWNCSAPTGASTCELISPP